MTTPQRTFLIVTSAIAVAVLLEGGLLFLLILKMQRPAVAVVESPLPAPLASVPTSAPPSPAATGNLLGHLLLFPLLALALAFYLLPSLVAWFRGHHNFGAILAVNVFLGGCLGLGWFIALIWALTSPPPPATVTIIQENENRNYR